MGEKTSHSTSVKEKLEEIQHELAKSMPQSPVAYSVNGKDFYYETPLSQPLAIGSYVRIKPEGVNEYLGQIITQELATKEGPEYGIGVSADANVILTGVSSSSQLKDRMKIQYIHGVGKLLGISNREDFSSTTEKDIFQDADIFNAENNAIDKYLISITSNSAVLEIGNVLHIDGYAKALLKAKGFDRHTFLCGQSGSGKTFALGVLIEQLLLNTKLKIVVLDPNSDFVKLDQFRTLENINKTRLDKWTLEKFTEVANNYNEKCSSIRIMRVKSQASHPSNSLQIRFSDLGQNEQEAILRLDPLIDREECHLFWDTIGGLSQQINYSFADVYRVIKNQSSNKVVERIKHRIENLRIADWDIWCPTDGPSWFDELDKDWRCMVVDIGMLPPPQNSVIAMATLEHFWRIRNKKEPILIVIDEAHHICPQSPLSIFDSLSTEHSIQIAGEGRKFGMYLLIATQRPEKVHSNVVSQCDNLVLMRMNSRKDLKFIEEIFSQIPLPLLNQSTNLNQGEALLAGKIVTNVTYVKFGGRLSIEGGSDVPSSWADIV
jgi:hypothetical protein